MTGGLGFLAGSLAAAAWYWASTCRAYAATEGLLRVWRIAAKPPTADSPAGISMNESTMIRKPWTKSV